MLKILYILSLAIISLTGAALYTNKPKMIDWAAINGDVVLPASYHKQSVIYPEDIEHEIYERPILEIIEGKDYANKADFDLLGLLPPLNGDNELERIMDLNVKVNHVFHYCSGPFNYMFAEPPVIALMIGCGDCKAYAFYKYWTLRQMGYKNVKLITVAMPNGRGHLAGHVVVLLNDIWVMDINYPYFYPFEILKEQTVLEEAYFPDGSIWDVE